MTDKPPLLLLSSGARPRYLEDIVRVLALPVGGRIQFRYENRILANGVRSHFRDKGLVGHKCYLTYLDNRVPGKKPEMVPVREAVILEANVRGNSLILVMEVSRYIRTGELTTIRTFIESNAQDQLPAWRVDHQQHPDDPLIGYWVNFLNSPLSEVQLVPHDSAEAKHLEVFEQCVTNLCSHEADFGDPTRKLFFNIIGMTDAYGATNNLVKGGWKLFPGKQYRIAIYHYFPEEGPLAKRETYWLGCRAVGEGISILGSGALRADSEYDSKTIEIQTAGSVRESQNALTIFRSTNLNDESATSAELAFNVEVGADRVRNVTQALVIGVFVAIPGLIAVYPDVPSWKGAMILAGGLLAGFASVFRYNKAV